jgi:hypothetical protein
MKKARKLYESESGDRFGRGTSRGLLIETPRRRTMQADTDASPIDRIMALAGEVINDCPACAGKATEIRLWAGQIRERRPNDEELAAVVDATCPGALSRGQRATLIDALRALVRFAE